MFGSLFDEGGDKSGNVMTTVHSVNTAGFYPPKPRPACGLSGILNQGATCYLNSLLQTLLFTPEFREGLFSLTESELGVLEDKEKGGKVRIIPIQLQRLFARLLLLDQEAASTTDLTDSFGWEDNEGLQEHDVQELNRILFCAIEKSLIGTTGCDLISKLYHGSMFSEIVCQTCGKISEREEDFLDLNVIVANFSNLQDSLCASYLQVEMMKGANQYRCSTCCKLVDAKKGLKIRCLPPILTFCLSRFSYDIAKGERIKETGKFAFPLELDMAPYCDKEIRHEDSAYELFSVVIHSGSSYGGHYHAYIKDIDHLGKWFAPDEEPLVLPSPGTNNISTVQGPVALIKTLLLQQPDHCLSVDTLCQEILKSTGLSWGKRFKNSHGPINKFLQKHSDIFFFNSATNLVYLKDVTAKEASADDAMSVDGSPVNSSGSAPSSPKESKKTSTKNPLKLNLFEKKKALSAFESIVDQCWFDFSDSKVNPIFAKDIEKQFSGKESAYMLFYRRKSLIRPEEAKGNAKYKMPQRLLNMVNNENTELAQQRELHETMMNTITCRVHFSEHYHYEHGALHLKEGGIGPFELTIDRRKSLLETKEIISKAWPDTNSMCPESNARLYIAKSVPAGFHLYEKLEPSQNDVSLTELGVLEGTDIFLSYEDKTIGGVTVSVGSDCEPILLHIAAVLVNGESSNLSTGIPKSTTFAELKTIISVHVPLNDEDIVVSKLEEQGNETRKVRITEDRADCKLSELSLKDNDNLIVETLSYYNSLNSLQKTITLIVQDQCTVFEDGTGTLTKFPITEINVTLESVIQDVKALLISKFGLNGSKQYRLRKCGDGLRKSPPLHENQTVKEANLTDARYLVVEEGKAPSDDEITVLLSATGDTLDDDCLYEVTLSKKQTVQQCLKLLLRTANLPGDNWKLQKITECGESETLYLETTTLEEEGILHGDMLTLTASHVPPKGFINYKIWLYPTLENLCCANRSAVNGIICDYANLYKSLSTVSKNECGLIQLGEIEISGDSTVLDLKKCVLTLPVFSVVQLPTVHYLRMRQLDGRRPSKVIRGLGNSLKKLRLHTHRSLCVQLLAHEEDLTAESIILNVCVRNPNERTYTAPAEITWNTSESPNLKALKNLLSNNFDIPIDRLIVAKHLYDRYEWQIIEDNSAQKKMSKRLSIKKSNLRYAPYYLKDGDTIGIKDECTDPNGLDDFTTAEDLEGQELLKRKEEQEMEINDERNRIIDGKRQRRQRRNSRYYDEWTFDRTEFDAINCTKKCERGIKIYVDDFG